MPTSKTPRLPPLEWVRISAKHRAKEAAQIKSGFRTGSEVYASNHAAAMDWILAAVEAMREAREKIHDRATKYGGTWEGLDYITNTDTREQIKHIDALLAGTEINAGEKDAALSQDRRDDAPSGTSACDSDAPALTEDNESEAEDG